MAAPAIMMLTQLPAAASVPFFVWGPITTAAGVLMWLLPDTLGASTPETMQVLMHVEKGVTAPASLVKKRLAGCLSFISNPCDGPQACLKHFVLLHAGRSMMDCKSFLFESFTAGHGRCFNYQTPQDQVAQATWGQAHFQKGSKLTVDAFGRYRPRSRITSDQR